MDHLHSYINATRKALMQKKVRNKHIAWKRNKQQEQTDLCKVLEQQPEQNHSSLQQEMIQQQTTNLISMGESKCICHTEGSHANIEKIPAIKDEPLSAKLFHFVTKLSLLVYQHSKIYKPTFFSLLPLHKCRYLILVMLNRKGEKYSAVLCSTQY